MIYVILGTTASGKTDLSLTLAKEFNMPLINADAYQVYKEFKLGTAVPSEEELIGVKHHFILDRSIKNPIDVKQYQDEVRKLLDEYVNNGQDVIISGGTFLYIRAALYSYDFPSEVEENTTYDNYTQDELYELLIKRDKEVAATLHKNNVRRVKRALINLDNQKDLKKKDPELLYPATFFAIDKDVSIVNESITLRASKMFESGLVEEVKDLLSDKDNITTAFMAIGYKEIKEGLEKNSSIEEMKEEVIIHTRQYAKRQRTFLRHQFEGIKFMSNDDIYKMVSFDQKKKLRTIKSLGQKVYGNIEKTKVLVCGLGGVGAIVASSLARLGVKNITIVDKDVVEESNLNRQELYNYNDIGKSKAIVAKEKLLEIDPLIKVNAIDELIDESFNLSGYDFIFDCIDDVKAKVYLAKYASTNNIELIMCTGTARKLDSTKIKCGYLSETGEPLAKAVKKILKEDNINIDKIRVVYSNEPAIKSKEVLPSLPTVPNASGLAMVSYFIEIIKNKSI